MSSPILEHESSQFELFSYGSCNTKRRMDPSDARSILCDLKHELANILRSKKEEEQRAWVTDRVTSLQTQKLEQGAAKLTKKIESFERKLND